MAKTKTVTSAAALNLALPPEGGSLSVTASLEEDAHYLRVTLDKSENFKVAAGKKLRDLLVNQFANNRNALRDWYEENVIQGKEHRSWSVVERYLSVVQRYGVEEAGEIFAHQHEKRRIRDHEYDVKRGRVPSAGPGGAETTNENNGVSRQPVRLIKTEYDLRKEWLSDMNHLWFKGNREWQDRWLKDRRLSRDRGSD
jgi:hypothetical protein